MDLNSQIEQMKTLLSSPDTSDDARRLSFPIGQESLIEAVSLWEGILLWTNDIHLSRLIYPRDIFDEKNYLLLNICHRGRCEVELTPGSFIYMSPGILDLSACPPKSNYHYPGGVYSGIELCLNLRILKDNMPEALTDYGFDYPLLERYAGRGNILASLSPALLQEEEKLFDMIRNGEASLPALRFATLSLIYHLANGECTEITRRTLVSKGQRRIVTEAEQMLTSDLQRRYTTEEIAAHFGISASALKNYFQAVYGRPVFQYMREKRMQKAMELLADTNHSVGEIALSCGYEHQGKFGTAFREYTGVSPLEYRRLNKKHP